MRLRRAVSALAVTLVTASALTVVTDVGVTPTAQAAVVKKRLLGMTKSLKVAREVRRGYDRDKFSHWSSQGEGCDTRDLVLIKEAKVEPRMSGDCDLRRGR